MLLTYGQPKYRLFLLCEGNGDGTGVHFLDKSKHKGYMLDASEVPDLIKKSVGLLRFSLQVKMIKLYKNTEKVYPKKVIWVRDSEGLQPTRTISFKG